MTEINDLPPTEIEVIDPLSFKLLVDATNFKPYEREGIVEKIKMPKKTAFKSL